MKPASKKKEKTKQRLWHSKKSDIPSYLSPILTHYHDDIWCTPIFEEKLVVQLMVEGFLPIACQHLLLPKLHKERCVIRWPDFHISKSVKKKGKRWEITINQRFGEVVKGCHKQHGISWLYPKIVSSFQAIHASGMNGYAAMIIKNGKKTGFRLVRLYSIEIWNVETGELVAGELGYAFGSIYTSLTGFSLEDSAGSAQLAALGILLQNEGFTLWDLGMYLEYKKNMGAHLMPRDEFLEEVRISREDAIDKILPCVDRVNLNDILRPSKGNSNNEKQLKNKKKEKNSAPAQVKRPRGISPNSVQNLQTP